MPLAFISFVTFDQDTFLAFNSWISDTRSSRLLSRGLPRRAGFADGCPAAWTLARCSAHMFLKFSLAPSRRDGSNVHASLMLSLLRLRTSGSAAVRRLASVIFLRFSGSAQARCRP